MKDPEPIIVNRMVGKVPLVGSFSPIQLGSAVLGFLFGVVTYNKTENPVYAAGVFLWLFFTSVLLLGKNHWEYVNKYRKQAFWSTQRQVFNNPLETKKNDKSKKKKS